MLSLAVRRRVSVPASGAALAQLETCNLKLVTVLLPMHTPEIRQKFVERRAQGWSLTRIATELDAARSTLIEWSRQLRFQLQNQTAIELDDLQHRLLGPRQHRAQQSAEKLAAVENELRKRDVASLSTLQLFQLSATLRRQIMQETDGIRFVAPVKDIPNDEYIEQVQEWNP
jgi:hypothetical protein